jgi:hypothetical protein
MVTLEMLMGTVPLIDAVTEPIWATPAAKVGRVAKDTGWVVWKKVPETGTVPEIEAVTLPICAVPAPIVTVPAPIVTTPMRFVPAGRAEPRLVVTVPEMGRGFAVVTLSPPEFPKYICIGRGSPFASVPAPLKVSSPPHPILTALLGMVPLKCVPATFPRFAVTVPEMAIPLETADRMSVLA